MPAKKTDVTIVSTALNKPEVARRMAKKLINARLAACVQLFPANSIYRWKEKMVCDSEILLAAKTTKQRTNALMAFIKANHPYELPEIIACPAAAALPAYSEWVKRETQPGLSKKTQRKQPFKVASTPFTRPKK